MHSVVISGAGLWTPDEIVTNEELVEAYNGWASRYNEQHAAEIAAGDCVEKPLSSAEFIEKASGIKQRYTYCKEGILDVDRMRPEHTRAVARRTFPPGGNGVACRARRDANGG